MADPLRNPPDSRNRLSKVLSLPVLGLAHLAHVMQAAYLAESNLFTVDAEALRAANPASADDLLAAMFDVCGRLIEPCTPGGDGAHADAMADPHSRFGLWGSTGPRQCDLNRLMLRATIGVNAALERCAYRIEIGSDGAQPDSAALLIDTLNQQGPAYRLEAGGGALVSSSVSWGDRHRIEPQTGLL